MTVRTYRAATMAEALAAVKQELGRNAVIMNTRSFRKGGLLGLIGGRPMWEVTASGNANVLRRGPRGWYQAEEPDESQPAVPKAAIETPAAAEPSAAVPGDGVAEEVGRLRRLVEVLVRYQGAQRPADGGEPIPPQLNEFAKLLRQQEVCDPLSRQILRELRLNLTGRQLADREFIRKRLRDLVISRLPTAAPFSKSRATERGRVIALIGPTGVGKTTTIAKLAANFKLSHGMHVGLITIDTYRIAAVEQLRTYAQIIDVPVRVVLTPEDLRQAIYALRGTDVMLIDTAGRSPKDRMRISQLRRFLDAAQADEVHLVISAAASQGWVSRTLQHFGSLSVTNVILTKLDEAETFGTILNVGATGAGEISYVTTGQEVPDDIAVADAQQMADWVLGGSFHVG